MSVPDSEQLIKIAVILETTVSELLGTQVENEEEPDQLAKELSRINTQLAIRNHRTRRVLKIIAVALLVIAALFFAMMALNYAPMSQIPSANLIWNGFLRVTMKVLNQCHLVKLIGSLRGKPLTKIYKL